MSAYSELTKREIEKGLKPARPMRCLSEVLAEHRALVAFATQVRDAPAGQASAGMRAAAALLVKRCEALLAEERAA